MNVTYSEKAKQSSDKYTLLQEATNKLAEVAGKSSARLKAEWDRSEDGMGRDLYTLRITDLGDSAKTSFAPDELKPSYHLQIRLYRLWGELLQARNERQLQAMSNDKE